MTYATNTMTATATACIMQAATRAAFAVLRASERGRWMDAETAQAVCAVSAGTGRESAARSEIVANLSAAQNLRDVQSAERAAAATVDGMQKAVTKTRAALRKGTISERAAVAVLSEYADALDMHTAAVAAVDEITAALDGYGDGMDMVSAATLALLEDAQNVPEGAGVSDWMRTPCADGRTPFAHACAAARREMRHTYPAQCIHLDDIGESDDEIAAALYHHGAQVLYAEDGAATIGELVAELAAVVNLTDTQQATLCELAELYGNKHAVADIYGITHNAIINRVNKIRAKISAVPADTLPDWMRGAVTA